MYMYVQWVDEFLLTDILLGWEEYPLGSCFGGTLWLA